MKRFNSASPVELIVERAIRSGIALYACHTNLDRAPGGMSHVLAQKLGLENISVLDPFVTTPSAAGAAATPPLQGGEIPAHIPGFGAIGLLPSPTPPEDFLRFVATTLNVKAIRHSALLARKVRRIALMTGSGGDAIERAIAAGADVFLTADLRYDRFLSAAGYILLADIGHFESEFCAIELICDIISKKIPTFALHKSAQALNPVNYLV
jgi:putative NIF3 family GTP cyclohydrolase 1 type 2